MAGFALSLLCHMPQQQLSRQTCVDGSAISSSHKRGRFSCGARPGLKPLAGPRSIVNSGRVDKTAMDHGPA